MINIINSPLIKQAPIQRHYSTSNLISRTKSRSISSRIHLTLINIKQTRILIFCFIKQPFRFILRLNQEMLNGYILTQITKQLAIITMISNGQWFISRNQSKILKRLKHIFMLRTYIFIMDKNQPNLDLIIEPPRMNLNLKVALFEAIPGLFRLKKINTSQLNWVQDFQRGAADHSVLAGLGAGDCKVMGVVLRFDPLFVV